ncbi:MAG TPA: hypothetical protein PLD23_00620 [Armatimonadota bacterium]|nr:hypothetical protein [Armatimonadota bacterium]HQK91973.1 hypothetical protein [Armatimonadota bacterium]
MTDGRDGALESALAALERDADATVRTAAAAVKAAKALQKAAKLGELRRLDALLAAAGAAATAVSQQVDNTMAGWQFDAAEHLASGEFAHELIAAARAQGVAVVEQDGMLYCCPSLVRVLPGELSVRIDKTRETRLRPTVLAAHLKGVQQRPPRFASEAFLDSLHRAYRRVVEPAHFGRVVKLLELYELLTLLPGQAREYTKAEFARDVYLLDRSGSLTTRNGAVATLHASTGTKSPSAVLRTITETGEKREYYGIAFRPAD